MNHLARAASALCIAAAFMPAARAEGFGGLQLASDQVSRGVSESDRKPSFGGNLGWRHEASGLYGSLGAQTVSEEQYVGSDGYKLMPELGWSHSFEGDWRAGLSLRGLYFPGARGPWFGNLPARAQSVALTANDSDYGTLEAGITLGWKLATLSWSRSLTNYLGLEATETGPAGTRLLESAGTTYLGLDLDVPLGGIVRLLAGAGRLTVPDFDELSYTDWRLGVAAAFWGLDWTLFANGSNANRDVYRARRRNGAATEGGSSSNSTVTLTVGWYF